MIYNYDALVYIVRIKNSYDFKFCFKSTAVSGMYVLNIYAKKKNSYQHLTDDFTYFYLKIIVMTFNNQSFL